MLLRVRVSSFLAGFGLASAAALWQLRTDIITSSEYLAAQVRASRGGGGGDRRRSATSPADCCTLRFVLTAALPSHPIVRLNLTPPLLITNQAQEARDAMDGRVAALEALVLSKQQAAAAAEQADEAFAAAAAGAE
jgi:hypothetical protein